MLLKHIINTLSIFRKKKNNIKQNLPRLILIIILIIARKTKNNEDNNIQ